MRVGALLAATYRPLLGNVDGKRPGLPRQLANVAGDAGTERREATRYVIDHNG